MASPRLRLRDKLVIFDRAIARRLGFGPSVTVSPRRIYVSRDTALILRKPPEGEVVALDRRTLAVEWRVKTDNLGAHSEWDEATLVLGSATHVGALDVPSRRVLWKMGTVVGRHRWADKLMVLERDRLTLVAVDVHTGDRQLVHASSARISFSVMCEDTLILNLWDNESLHRAYDLRTRSLVWEVDLLRAVKVAYGVEDTCVSLTPGFLPGHFVMTAGMATLGGSVATGAILWKTDVFCAYYWPLVERGRIPILTSEEFVVLDEATGAVLCRRAHGLAHVWHPRPGSLVSDDVFGTVTEEGHVMLFDMHTAELLSWAQHNVSFQGTAAADGRFFVVGSDGKLWVYEPLA